MLEGRASSQKEKVQSNSLQSIHLLGIVIVSQKKSRTARPQRQKYATSSLKADLYGMHLPLWLDSTLKNLQYSTPGTPSSEVYMRSAVGPRGYGQTKLRPMFSIAYEITYWLKIVHVSTVAIR